MEKYIDLLKSYEYFGNNAYDYFWSLVIFFIALIVLKFIQVVIIVRLRSLAKKTKNDIDDMAISVFDGIKPPFYFLISLYIAIKSLVLTGLVDKIFYVLLVIVVVYEVVRALERILDYSLQKYAASHDGANVRQSKSMMRILKIMISTVLWVIALLMVLSNLGVNITSLVASLGIGGIAVALALQNVLSDLLSSFSIFMDRPFEVGDYIQVGTDSGTVERIGMKTTRIKTLLGEELGISFRT